MGVLVKGLLIIPIFVIMSCGSNFTPPDVNTKHSVQGIISPQCNDMVLDNERSVANKPFAIFIVNTNSSLGSSPIAQYTGTLDDGGNFYYAFDNIEQGTYDIQVIVKSSSTDYTTEEVGDYLSIISSVSIDDDIYGEDVEINADDIIQDSDGNPRAISCAFPADTVRFKADDDLQTYIEGTTEGGAPTVTISGGVLTIKARLATQTDNSKNYIEIQMPDTAGTYTKSDTNTSITYIDSSGTSFSAANGDGDSDRSLTFHLTYMPTDSGEQIRGQFSATVEDSSSNTVDITYGEFSVTKP